MGAALNAHGLPYRPDQNGAWEDGHFPIPISNLDDRRVSTAIAYLDPETRRRANLTILTETTVSQLLFDGLRCIGVAAEGPAGTKRFDARETILSCGAINSPAQLLRAGIGPARHLRGLGIEVLANRPGVGAHLMDHPSVAIAAFIKPHARINGRTRRHLMMTLRFSSGLDGAPDGDMAATVSSKSAWHAVGEQIATLNLWVNKTYSAAGQVRLQSADWRVSPMVDLRDLVRLAASIRRFAPLFDTPEMQAVVSDAFPASYSDKVRQVGELTWKNRVLTSVLAKLMDGPAALRRTLITRLICEGASLDVLMRDEDAMDAFVRHAAVGVWHASCSCRMGADDDKMAVTTPTGEVRGVAGLRVVDASIFPVIPRANTNLPTIMAAERISDTILQEQ